MLWLRRSFEFICIFQICIFIYKTIFIPRTCKIIKTNVESPLYIKIAKEHYVKMNYSWND